MGRTRLNKWIKWDKLLEIIDTHPKRHWNHSSMFHDTIKYVFTICFTICLWFTIFTIDFTICLIISLDWDGHRAPKNGSLTLRDPEQISKPKDGATALLHSHPIIGYPNSSNGQCTLYHTICFTIYLFISPDLDGHRAPKNGSCFTVCLLISPDLDGYRAPKMKYCPRYSTL